MRVTRLIWVIGTMAVSRIALNTSRRFAYPFAPVLSRGMGVSLAAVTSLLATNQATGILSLFFAPIGDYTGYRIMMTAGLGVLAVGMFAGGLLPLYGVMLMTFFCAGLGKAIFDPALHAYLGERVPFEKRGLVIGITETSWAASALVGIPGVALLIDRFDWRAPLFALGGMALIGVIALRLLIPDEKKEATSSCRTPLNFGASWHKLVKERSAIGMIGYAFFLSAASDNLFVVYGAWLEHIFGLSIVALGFSTSVIGMAELSGEGLTAFLADRVGLKRGIVFGLVFSGLSYLLLPFLERSLALALAGLFLIFITFEFTIVTSLSFCTEILPEARATMMASYLAFSNLGRICGTISGGKLWATEQIFVIGLVSSCMTVCALIALLWGLRYWTPTQRRKGAKTQAS